MSQKRGIRYTVVGVSTLLVLLVAYLLLWPIPIKPLAWTPSPIPPSVGIHAKNHDLDEAEILFLAGRGPEDLTVGPDGDIYAGLEDGRIIHFDPERPEEFLTYVNTGGRPLGLKFAGDGHLIVADGVRGLLSVDQDRQVHVLTDKVDDSPLVFVNHLDIAGDGKIWFSDSSQRFKGEPLLDMMEGSSTGRLLSYDPMTGITKVHLEGLRFANGVSVGPDDAYVLVAETLAARVMRLWLQGPKRGISEAFMEGLPGYPDNISHNGYGEFWIALPMQRIPVWESLANKPILRSMLMRLPSMPSPAPSTVAWVLKVDTNGNVLGSHQNWSSEHSMVTSATEIHGVLYLGTLELESIARVPLSKLRRED